MLRKCKYCDKPAKLNIINGRNKGYLRTCGSLECLNHRNVDKDVCSKKYKRNKQAFCKHCGSEFLRHSSRQVYCSLCSTDHKSRCRLYRYGITQNWWDIKFKEQNGLCAICGNKIPTCVDHCHNDGKVRGLLCNHCNFGLSFIENAKFRTKCYEYIKSHGGISNVPVLQP